VAEEGKAFGVRIGAHKQQDRNRQIQGPRIIREQKEQRRGDEARGLYNILVGNGGNVLTGGTGRRNLLVAGPTASTLIGGDDDDILIGGATDYDTRDDWQAAFTALMNEWTQATDYATRVDHLLNGGGLNDPYLLNATTVHSNGGGNTLTGHGGGASELNLYFANLALGDTTDCDPTLGELCIPIT
jgi:hypothetical protein